MSTEERSHTTLGEDTTIADLITLGRDIWGDRSTDTTTAVTILTVVVGDLARAVRDGFEMRGEWADIEREIGNLVVSAIRLADDLGIDPGRYLTAAEKAQRAYVREHR